MEKSTEKEVRMMRNFLADVHGTIRETRISILRLQEKRKRLHEDEKRITAIIKNLMKGENNAKTKK